MNGVKQRRVRRQNKFGTPLFWIIFTVGAMAMFAIAFYLSKIEKVEMISSKGFTYEKARVISVEQDNLNSDGVRIGYQRLIVEITSGENKGKYYYATSAEGNLFGAVCKEGDDIIVNMSTSGDTTVVSVYSMDRTAKIGFFVGIFLLLICIIGGKNGIKAVLGLCFTFICIIYIMLPLLYLGYSPFVVTVFVCIVTTLVTMTLISGYSDKTIISILGTTIGVIMAGVFAWVFGKVCDIDGYNVSNIETLIYVEQNTDIKVGELLFSGILIAALGAVMDVAMSVTSAMCEIYDKADRMSAIEFFKSGMNVGRDMMGTMSNTLILAFAGGSISIIVIDYVYDLPFYQLINSYSIGIEIMQGISGSIGIILAVPITAAICTLFKYRKRE